MRKGDPFKCEAKSDPQPVRQSGHSTSEAEKDTSLPVRLRGSSLHVPVWERVLSTCVGESVPSFTSKAESVPSFTSKAERGPSFLVRQRVTLYQ